MGACTSLCRCCCGGKNSMKESEMTSPRNTTTSTTKGTVLAISRDMSQPTVEIEKDMTVSGTGLALAGVSIEQDAAYWEWHIDIPNGQKSNCIMFGVTTKKDSKFYEKLDDAEEDTPNTNGTSLMNVVSPLHDGDTIGVAVQQSDLPMIQFLLNGEPQHDLSIHRFRGAVYPSLRLPVGETVRATLVLDEREFRHVPPHARFGPVIVSRGII